MEKVEIYLLNIAERLEKPVEFWLPLFSQERRGAILKYRFNADRNRTLWAELLARVLIAERTGQDLESVILWRDPAGKPHCAEPGVHLSLSHSGPWVACSVGGTPSGVDVETGRVVSLDIAKRFFLPGEYRHLKSLAERGGDWKRDFLRCWTLKESCLKCLGLKEWGSVDCAALLAGKGRTAGRNFALPDGSVAGVCAERDALPERANLLRLSSR
ncbi:MAG: 4'-phosphopantetheinyl transferase superfamily protein [Synergistaceae bacterium]|nr:4'-phosphopantetheinyl transferase superfamily protein [Synergistaceae bacterium]